MQFSWSFALSAFAGLAAAQTSTSAAGSASTAAAGSMMSTWIVQVGGTNGSTSFFPNNVKAAAGDYVQFQFHAQNHSVAQASFDSPCQPIQNNQNAFFSGYMPASNNILTYTIKVQDTNPVYFYSSQANDCQMGMVGAINAPSSGTGSLQSFVQSAAQAKSNVTPGAQSGTANTQSTPTTSSSGPSGSTSSASAASAASASPASSSAGAGSASSPSPSPSPSGNAAASLSSQSFFGLSAALAAALALL